MRLRWQTLTANRRESYFSSYHFWLCHVSFSHFSTSNADENSGAECRGSPTETLLRLLLPLKDQVRPSFSLAVGRHRARRDCSPRDGTPTSPSEGLTKSFNRLESRSLSELTRQIAPPTKNGHAPPPTESRKSSQSVNPSSVRACFSFATILPPEPKDFGFPEAARRVIGVTPTDCWLASFMENILGKCLRCCSSCGGPRISPLSPQYECPRPSLLTITSGPKEKTSKIGPSKRCRPPETPGEGHPERLTGWSEPRQLNASDHPPLDGANPEEEENETPREPIQRDPPATTPAMLSDREESRALTPGLPERETQHP
ncbi:hypothetical protein OUZ56_033917 [Daphnia magna]|uniref:Uncharacterized protein n=1 Tax=Daphnia magna TaxID=35525 RepID=A0ABR0BBA0_9CRUS|nr:hypothetical protein OUZ56_033917 [Daphnia magna]